MERMRLTEEQRAVADAVLITEAHGRGGMDALSESLSWRIAKMRRYVKGYPMDVLGVGMVVIATGLAVGAVVYEAEPLILKEFQGTVGSFRRILAS